MILTKALLAIRVANLLSVSLGIPSALPGIDTFMVGEPLYWSRRYLKSLFLEGKDTSHLLYT